jgi:hypothetical protein
MFAAQLQSVLGFADSTIIFYGYRRRLLRLSQASRRGSGELDDLLFVTFISHSFAIEDVCDPTPIERGT